jgi:small subunit ribosomal protein S2
MEKLTFEQMLQAGVHFGHLKRKWNPHMAPFIFTEKKGIHIIDLHKTGVKLDEAASAMKQIAKSGKKILFVATKKQAKSIVAERVAAIGMPYVTERWSGGMLTNFATIRKAVRKMSQIDKMEQDGTLNTLSKRERLQVSRQRAKLEKNLGSISDLTRIPAAIFIVDVMKEHIALAEAKKLGIPVFAMVDTNSDPRPVDFPIPSNDDAGRSIALVMDVLAQAVAEGLQERKADKDQAEAQAAAKKSKEKAPAEAAAPAEEAPAAEAPAAEAPAEEAAPAPEAPASEEGEAPAAEEK